jgi:hypothetical protein
MSLNRLLWGLALTTVFAMGLPVAPAYADDVQYTLTDSSGDVITFTLPAVPTPVADSADWFAESTTVTVDGLSSAEDVTFYDSLFLGGLSIASTPFTDQILDQSGSVLFTGTTAAPMLSPFTNLALICTSITPAPPCAVDTYDEAFTLNAADIPTAAPEPTSFSLTLVGFGFLAFIALKTRA